MSNIDEILQYMETMQNSAYRIIADLKIIELWEEIGAEVNLVGSLKMGLLVKHKDIDFHIYTNELLPETALNVIAKISNNTNVKKVEYINLSNEDDCCLEFHLFVEDNKKELWQIDLINIKAGSKYDGYFEKITDNIINTMTSEQKRTICKLKYITPEKEKISGVEYYKAVIQDNVKTWSEFMNWRKNHFFNGIIEW